MDSGDEESPGLLRSLSTGLDEKSKEETTAKENTHIQTY